MRIYKLSLGNNFFNDQKFQQLTDQSSVCVHPETAAKGLSSTAQGEAFLQAQAGDLFYVCRSNDSIEFVGMFSDNRPFYSTLAGQEDWTERSYVLIADAIHPTIYDGNYDKWWMPKNNSTFIEIPGSDFADFESSILRPVFEMTLEEIFNRRNQEVGQRSKNANDYLEMQKRFKRFRNDPNLLFEEINALGTVEWRKLLYSYELRGNVDRQPVVLLRKKVLESLLSGQQLSLESLSHIKEEISRSFEKNVFHVWKDPFRILYTFLYDPYKAGLVRFFYDMIYEIKAQLAVQSLTKQTVVHFDGPQNQGTDRLWFAIYNNSYPSQKMAKQLFLVMDEEISFGLLDGSNLQWIERKSSGVFELDEIIAVFKKHVHAVLNDNSKEMITLSQYLDILEYKNQIILQGPPGTGKTHTANRLARQLTGDKFDENTKFVQFHPSYTYEDFVRGIVTTVDTDGRLHYQTKDKILVEFAEKARQILSEKFVLIIDEINRANLPSVLGELIYALEYRNTPVNSLYAIENAVNATEIVLPDNLYIIGTMNTADRSIGHIDYAIKRRFAFIEILPQEEPIVYPVAKELFRLVSRLFMKVEDAIIVNSEFLAPDFDYKDVQLGHSYFLLKSTGEEEQKRELKLKLEYEILPLLNEYVKDGLLLESAKEEIHKIRRFVL